MAHQHSSEDHSPSALSQKLVIQRHCLQKCISIIQNCSSSSLHSHRYPGMEAILDSIGTLHRVKIYGIKLVHSRLGAIVTLPLLFPRLAQDLIETQDLRQVTSLFMSHV